MKIDMNELNLNELEMANGAGPITGGFGRYLIPDPKKRKGETGSEQKDN